jgi:rhodanese-related sulfurtransferase
MPFMIDQIRPRELTSWIARHRDAGQAVVLDVREPAEWRTASIKAGEDFTLLTIPMGSVPPRLSELDPETPIACLCHHGGRSMQVAQFLHNQGFNRVANIAGGINAWADEVDNSVPRY